MGMPYILTYEFTGLGDRIAKPGEVVWPEKRDPGHTGAVDLVLVEIARRLYEIDLGWADPGMRPATEDEAIEAWRQKIKICNSCGELLSVLICASIRVREGAEISREHRLSNREIIDSRIDLVGMARERLVHELLSDLRAWFREGCPS